MGSDSVIGNFAKCKYAGHVGHISCEITVCINHNGLPSLDDRPIGSNRE